MTSLKGTKTEKNLLASFAGESQARNRYTFFSSKARKEGYIQISAIFQETADNEKEHAERFFKFLEGGMVEIQASFPSGVIGSTTENLKAAAAGENEEWTVLYPEAARVAREEGFEEIAELFESIARVEREHEARYLALFQNIQNGKIFKREQVVKWKCRNCGYIHDGAEAPEICPACAHPQGYYEIWCKTY
ncbi:rubrerythrin family protein [bacterium]|nr:rubrerythrin family protein [bacterium]